MVARSCWMLVLVVGIAQAYCLPGRGHFNYRFLKRVSYGIGKDGLFGIAKRNDLWGLTHRIYKEIKARPVINGNAVHFDDGDNYITLLGDPGGRQGEMGVRVFIELKPKATGR